jgi:hypothetical protein
LETATEPVPIVGKEKFAMYGLEVEIPADWRVEFNPKGNRKKGDVVFQSPKGNRFFVSWGPLEEAQKRFKTLEEHRDYGIKRVKKGPDVRSIDVTDLREIQITGHRALVSHVGAKLQRGMMSRGVSNRDIWSVHFHCPNSSRYYVIYSMQRDAQEYEDISAVFNNLISTVACHPSRAGF